MKKQITAITLTFALLFSVLLFSGCSSNKSDDESAEKSAFPWDVIQKLPKSYMIDPDYVLDNAYSSMEEYKNEVFVQGQTSGSLVLYECVDYIPYITLRHDGDSWYMEGKTVVKFKITSVIESYNGHKISEGELIESTYSYYIMPKNEDGIIKVLESFGAKIEKDAEGNPIDVKISDGDYVLQYDENVEYELMIHYSDVLMEVGQQYKGFITGSDDQYSVSYVSLD